MQEEFEDTKGVIRIRKSQKDRQNNGQKKRTKEQTTIYKTLHTENQRSNNTKHTKNREFQQSKGKVPRDIELVN
jgi:hypothetical protein